VLFAALVTVLRWIVMAFSPPIAVLVVLQMTHGICYALGFLGCMHFIANWTSEDIAAEAQGYFTTLQQAMAVLAITVFGWLVAQMGPSAFIVAAGFALAGAGCIWLSLRLQQPKG
jgi:PPP family 3-phenylpropionic acid transporter